MKYCVENDLRLFEFHDSTFSFVSFNGKDMTVAVNHLNIHKATLHNPSDYDMEIDCAQITFKNFRCPSYAPGRTWEMDENGTCYPVGPQTIFSGQEAESKILAELKNQFTVLDFSQQEDGGYSIDGCGIEPFFTIRFAFDSVIIEWDTYKKKAWYEIHRQYRYDLTLATPNGDEQVDLIVSFHDEDIYHKGALEKSPTVNVSCTYNGKNFGGHGSDDLWIDAFADLQNQLPSEVYLKCCLTCRHGNLCPVGNVSNEVFCTKDVAISQKSDLFFYTEDETEREKRSRTYCFVCKEYLPQNAEFYTYNDYLHSLKHGCLPAE